MVNLIQIWKVGCINYAKSIKLQQYLANLHKLNTKNNNNIILLLEHPPVYTTGIRTKEYTIDDEIKLKSKGADFYRTNRGGLITFHGPGQLIVYPILNLKNFQPSIKWYIHNIENTIINLCDKFQLKASRNSLTGVWINDNKICAIGVHGSRFITTHGLALNCNTNLEWFNHIIPCGIKDKGVTSLSKELNRLITVDECIPYFLDSFSQIFSCDFYEISQYDIKNILSNI